MAAPDSPQRNPATIWAQTLVDALARAGLQAVCLAPGSRSTALVLAFAAHPEVRVYRHLDERSAGYFALGMALARERPVVLLCTSGTAGANFFPAIVEARMAQVPLLVITADRPPELRHSGANQTIDQVKLYGDQVLWSVDVALPEKDAPAVALRNLRTLAARALATAGGLVKGPVHLNVPLRKPFEPAPAQAPPVWEEDEGPTPATRMVRGKASPPADDVATLASLLARHPRGLIVCGPRCPGGDFPAAVAALARRAAYPIMADPLSGLRYGPWVQEALVCGGYESMLAQAHDPWGPPQVVLRFGAVPTSKWLNAYLERSAPPHVVHVRGNGVWADDAHRVQYFLQADEALTCRALASQVSARDASPWQEQIRAAEAACWQALDAASDGDYFDGAVLTDVAAQLPPDALLFVGNSLPVRHLDQFGRPRAQPLHAFGNRGASGIDGNTSTALGLAAARQQPVTLVVGDVTFYHDMNGLQAVREHDLAPTIVLLNNDGGGIFRRLPVATFDPPFTDLFLTPHGLDFAPAAQMYGLEHVQVQEGDAFRRVLATALAEPRPRLIEVRTDGERDEARRQALVQRVLAALPESGAN